jgi:hypothetical protein
MEETTTKPFTTKQVSVDGHAHNYTNQDGRATKHLTTKQVSVG